MCLTGRWKLTQSWTISCKTTISTPLKLEGLRLELRPCWTNRSLLKRFSWLFSKATTTSRVISIYIQVQPVLTPAMEPQMPSSTPSIGFLPLIGTDAMALLLPPILPCMKTDLLGVLEELALSPFSSAPMAKLRSRRKEPPLWTMCTIFTNPSQVPNILQLMENYQFNAIWRLFLNATPSWKANPKTGTSLPIWTFSASTHPSTKWSKKPTQP